MYSLVDTKMSIAFMTAAAQYPKNGEGTTMYSTGRHSPVTENSSLTGPVCLAQTPECHER